MAVAWPSVRAHLAEALPGVVGAGVTVIDGPVVSGENPSSYLTIAHQPSNPDDPSGTFEQQVGPDGYAAAETGDVRCELAAARGDATVPDVFAAFDAISDYVQGNQTLSGVLQPASVVTVSADVVQEQTTSGAVQRLLITVSYTTNVI